MIPLRSRGLWLLVLGLLTGLLALAALTVIALASTPDKSAGVSMALPAPYPTVVEAVRAVCADGVIRGTTQYESDAVISGASDSRSSALFPRWTGEGEVFYKTRPGAIAPAHFAGTRDRGVVTVRYVVEPGPDGHTRVTIDAVFVEDGHHGRHPSQGFVERAEFGEIAKQLKNTPAPGRVPAEAGEREPERQPATAAAAGPSAPPRRAYALAEDDLKKALQKLGAFDDAALPVLEGFTMLGPDRLVLYDRPHYQFRVAFEPAGSERTMVRIEAMITARYTDGAGARPEYRSVTSNGRLEADLLDRLDGYLRADTAALASGTAGKK